MWFSEQQRKALSPWFAIMALGAGQIGPTWGILLVAISAAGMAWTLWPNKEKRESMWRVVQRIYVPSLLVIALLAALPELPGSWSPGIRVGIGRAQTVLLLLALIAVVLYCIGEWSEKRSPQTASPPPAPAPSVTAADEILHLRNEIASAESTHRQLGEEVARLTEERDAYKRGALTRQEVLEYGEPLREMEPLPPAEYVAIRPSLEEMQHNLDKALGAAETLWTPMARQCQQLGSGSPLFFLERFVEENTVTRVGRVARLYRECLQYGRDPRPALAVLHNQYRFWRTWIFQFGMLLDHPVSSRPGYADWREADRLFFDELQRKLKIKQLREVKDSVESCSGQHSDGPPTPLPPAT